MKAFDTNVLAYAAGLRRVADDERKIAVANALVMEVIADEGFVLPAQVMAELHHVLRRKGGKPADLATEMVGEYADLAVVQPTDIDCLADAFQLASEHSFQTYDAIILATASRAGCDVLYSEDLQGDFTWQGVRVMNPFA